MGDFLKNLGPAGWVGLAAGVGQLISGLGSARRMKKMADKINPVWKRYEISGASKDMMGLAQARLNSRNPYSEAQRNAVLGAQAGSRLADIERGDIAYDQQNVANLMSSQNVMAGEERMRWQSEHEKFLLDQQRKDELTMASMQTKANAFGALAGTAAAVAGAGSVPNPSNIPFSYQGRGK